MERIDAWLVAGQPGVVIVAGALVALCFVVFNSIRILLYVPQLRSCLNDTGGCACINLFTWGSWIVANGSTGLYMWIFEDNLLGLMLNLGNAMMCTAIVCVAVVKKRCHARQRAAGAAVRRHHPAAATTADNGAT